MRSWKVLLAVAAFGCAVGYLHPNPRLGPPWDAVQSALGWTYTTAWSLSFYPQVGRGAGARGAARRGAAGAIASASCQSVATAPPRDFPGARGSPGAPPRPAHGARGPGVRVRPAGPWHGARRAPAVRRASLTVGQTRRAAAAPRAPRAPQVLLNFRRKSVTGL
jgi:hypothetical protein